MIGIGLRAEGWPVYRLPVDRVDGRPFGRRVENWRLHIQTAEAVYRPAAAVYRSAAEKGVDQSTAVYQVYR